MYFFVDASVKKRKNLKEDCACFLFYPVTFLFKFSVSDIPTKNVTLLPLEYTLNFFERISNFLEPQIQKQLFSVSRNIPIELFTAYLISRGGSRLKIRLRQSFAPQVPTFSKLVSLKYSCWLPQKIENPGFGLL